MLTITRTQNIVKMETDLPPTEAMAILAAWAFLVPNLTTWTGEQLAGAIRRYSTNPKAIYDANTLEGENQGNNL